MSDLAEYEYDDPNANLSDSDYEQLVIEILWPNWVELIFVAVLLCMMIIGVIGNTLVVTVVISKRSMWSTMNIFLTNLAVADLLILLFCLPATVLNDVTKTFWLSQPFCKSMIFAQNTSVYVSILSLVAITFERWRAVTCPLETTQAKKHPNPVILIGTWILALLFSSPEPMTLQLQPAAFNRKNFSTPWGTQCKETWSREFQRWYTVAQIIFSYLLPLGLIIFMCWQMRRTLKYCQLRQLGERQIANRRKAIRMLFAVLICFALSYLPVHMYNVASAFDWLTPPTEDFDMNLIAIRKLLPRVFSYSSSCLNPILYNFMCGRFRSAFARVVCCRPSSKNMKKRVSITDGTGLERRRPTFAE